SDIVNRAGESHGCLLSDQAAAGRIGPGAKRPCGRRRGYGVLYFAVADREEIAPGTQPDRHLRKDREVSKDSERQTLEAGGPPAQGRLEAQPQRNAQAFV